MKAHSGMIELDSDRGRELGFTSDRFTYGSYLWESDDRIMVSFIASRARGNFKRLVDAILATGKEIAVPTPLPMMLRILVKNGYTKTIEVEPEMGAIEVWVLKPKQERAA